MRGAGASLILTLALLAGGCGSSTDVGPAVPVDPAALYTQMCARCHGVDGRGDPVLKTQMPTLRAFSDPELRARPNDQIEQMIMAGKNQMPPFGGQLSLPKIQSLTGYVKRLGAGR
jgi:mono/diheme cytochrome c family protein